MILELKRVAYRETYTIGHLYVNGEYFCDTLEDRDREVKIMHETCINAGTYRVIINYSQRFKRLMPLLLNVPEFVGIRIHWGCTKENTSGCILVGKNSEIGRLTESRETFNKLYQLLDAATKRKEDIIIKITKDGNATSSF